MKMKKSIRVFTAVIVLFVLFGTFTGCGGSKKPEEETAAQPTTQAASTQEETVVVEEKVKLTIATYSDSQVPNDAKHVLAMNEKYGIELDIWPCFGDEYANQVATRLASGDMPDILGMQNGLDVIKMIEQDIIVPIDEEYIKREMTGYYNFLYENSENPFKLCKIDGKIYGFPSQNAEGVYHFTCVWRSDWLANVGISKTPETLEEYEQALYKFALEDPDKNGKKDTYGLSNKGMLPIYGAFGPIPFDFNANLRYFIKDGKIVCAATQPEMKEALRLLAKWYKDGVIDPEFVTGERTEGSWAVSQAFAKGRIGFSQPGMFYNTMRASDPPGRDGNFYKLFRETQDTLGVTSADYVIGKPPIGPNGASGAIKWGVENGINFAFTKALAKDEARMKKAANWLGNLWSNFDNYSSAWHGTKDVDWIYDPEMGVIQNQSEEMKTAAEKGLTAQLGVGGFFINDMPQMTKKINPKFYTYADEVASFTEGYYDVLAGAPLEAIGKYGADLGKMAMNAYYDIITGKKDIESFEDFVKEWENNGGKEILVEAEKWYAEVSKQ